MSRKIAEKSYRIRRRHRHFHRARTRFKHLCMFSSAPCTYRHIKRSLFLTNDCHEWIYYVTDIQNHITNRIYIKRCFFRELTRSLKLFKSTKLVRVYPTTKSKARWSDVLVSLIIFNYHPYLCYFVKICPSFPSMFLSSIFLTSNCSKLNL